MTLVVDDQLALLAGLGVLELPQETALPLLTVYSFQLRIASAVSVERVTEGVLQRLVSTYLRPGLDVDRVVHPDESIVRVVDPTRYAADIAKLKSEYRCNTLAAEVAAVARREGAEVRLTSGNAGGQLAAALTAASIPYAVWSVTPFGLLLRIAEQ